MQNAKLQLPAFTFSMQTQDIFPEKSLKPINCGLLLFAVLIFLCASIVTLGQDSHGSSITRISAQIEAQRQRLSSGDEEERRDAVMRLGALHHPAASKVASIALADISIRVRVAATNAVVSLPPNECASLLLPLLTDKIPFVRQEAVYALGQTHSRSAVTPLTALLSTEKDSGVRGAVAVALGQLDDETAVVALALLLAPETSATKTKKKSSSKENELVMRAAARSLGQIGSRSGLPALLAALQNEGNVIDVRREAAIALGRIGDRSAVSALRNVLTTGDPYFAEAAELAIRRIESAPQ